MTREPLSVSPGTQGNNTVSACLHIDINQLPIQYLGCILANLADVYSSATGGVLIMEKVQPGSMKLWFKAAKEKIVPFAELFNSILGKHLKPDNARRVADEHIEAVLNGIPMKHRKIIAETSNLMTKTSVAETQLRLEIMREYPVFIEKMDNLHCRFNPNASAEERKEFASKSANLYEATLGLRSSLLFPQFRDDHTAFVDMVRNGIRLEISETES